MRNRQFSWLVVVSLVAAFLALEVGASSSATKQELTYLQCLSALRATEGK